MIWELPQDKGEGAWFRSEDHLRTKIIINDETV